MKSLSLFAATCLVAVANAGALTINTCSSASKCFASKSDFPQASAFCSSYLSYIVATTTATATITPKPTTLRVTSTFTDSTRIVTSRTTTVVPVTNTIVVNSTVTSTVTATTTIFSQDYVTCQTTATTSTAYLSTTDNIKKRATSTASAPPCIVGYAAPTKSAICSCLNLPSSTTTLTSTITLPQATVTTSKYFSTDAPYTTSAYTKSKSVTTFVTSTSTVTSTATTFVTFIQPTPSVYLGMNYYQYYNSYDYTDADPGFDATEFNDPGYDRTGLIKDLSQLETGYFGSSGSASVYSQSGYAGPTGCYLPGYSQPDDCSYYTVVVQGYFFAPQAGNYTITTLNTIDNQFSLWSSEAIAYYNYDDDNADYNAVRAGDGPYYGGSMTYELAAGEYVPMTGMWVNGGGAGYNPTYVIDNYGNQQTTTGWFVPACDDNNPFAP